MGLVPISESGSPATAAAKTDVCYVRVALLLPGDRLTAARPDVQTFIPPHENHVTIAWRNAGTGIDFRKSCTFTVLDCLARPGHGLPAITQDNPARREIVHPLQPQRSPPRSCSPRIARLRGLRQTDQGGGAQSQEYPEHHHAAITCGGSSGIFLRREFLLSLPYWHDLRPAALH